MHGMQLGRAELPFPSFFLSLLILDPCYLYFLACFTVVVFAIQYNVLFSYQSV